MSASDLRLTLRSPLLSTRGVWELALGVARTPSLAVRALHDYSAWSDRDDRDGEAFAVRRFGAEAARFLLEPSLDTFYFHGLAACSRSLALVQLAYLMRPGTLYTLTSGLQALPEALAAPLDVRLDAEVHAVSVAGDRVTVSSRLGAHTARFLVLATTASVARTLFRPQSEVEAAVLAARYSSTVNLGVWFERAREQAPREYFGLAIPASERGRLAGIGVEACKDFGEPWESYNLMASGESASELAACSDETVAARLLADARRFVPELARQPSRCAVARWPEAAPLSPVGRAAAIARYRRAFRREHRVVLAGDYLGMPFLEGAAESGEWAATRLLEA